MHFVLQAEDDCAACLKAAKGQAVKEAEHKGLQVHRVFVFQLNQSGGLY